MNRHNKKNIIYLLLMWTLYAYVVLLALNVFENKPKTLKQTKITRIFLCFDAFTWSFITL